MNVTEGLLSVLRALLLELFHESATDYQPKSGTTISVCTVVICLDVSTENLQAYLNKVVFQQKLCHNGIVIEETLYVLVIRFNRIVLGYD